MKRSKHTEEGSLVSTRECQRYIHELGMEFEKWTVIYIHCSHTGSLSGEDEYRLSYKFLLKMVLSRCSDKAPRYGYLGVSTAISLVRTRCLKWTSGLYQLSHCLQNCEGKRVFRVKRMVYVMHIIVDHGYTREQQEEQRYLNTHPYLVGSNFHLWRSADRVVSWTPHEMWPVYSCHMVNIISSPHPPPLSFPYCNWWVGA